MDQAWDLISTNGPEYFSIPKPMSTATFLGDSYSQDRQDEEDHKTKGEQNKQTNKQTNRKEWVRYERDYAGATTVTSVAGATVQP